MPVIIVASAPLPCRKGHGLALPQRRINIIYFEEDFASNIIIEVRALVGMPLVGAHKGHPYIDPARQL